MKQFSQLAFQQARQFLFTRGRPLEQPLFNYTFEHGPVEPIYTALASYQNEDGGFGNALEPDVRTPSSSSLATTIALAHLKELGASTDHPLVQGAVRYLLDTFNPATHVWRIVPADTNEYPHAPWWHDENDSLQQGFGSYLLNPRAETVGLLHHFSALVPAAWLSDLTTEVVNVVIQTEHLDGHDLLCATRLAETNELPTNLKEQLQPRVLAAIDTVVERNPANWASYTVPPLWFASTPQALAASLLQASLQQNLDYVIDHQSSTGAWLPNWNWGGLYQDVWPQAEQEWSSVQTYNTLKQLHSFGRLDDAV